MREYRCTEGLEDCSGREFGIEEQRVELSKLLIFLRFLAPLAEIGRNRLIANAAYAWLRS